MTTTPFLLIKKSTFSRLTGQADAALAAWRAQWGDLVATVACSAASEARTSITGSDTWQRRDLASGIPVWFCLPAALERTLERQLFGLEHLGADSEPQRHSTLAAAVVAEASAALVQELTSALTGQDSSPASPTPVPARLLRTGSGALLCAITCAAGTLYWLLPAETGVAAPGKPVAGTTALSTLHQALAGTPVRLSVELGQAELTLGYLRTLAVGDVLALPAHLDQALRVCGPGERTVCHAHLGAQDGQHAVELIAAKS